MTEQALNSHEEWSFKLNPWITMVPLMLSIFMYALDETISNVALPYMAGTFSVSHNESTWIITSYLVASGIATHRSKTVFYAEYSCIYDCVNFLRNIKFHDNDAVFKNSAGRWRRRYYADCTGNDF